MYRLFFACLFCFSWALELRAQNLVTNHQLLWQITGKGLRKPSYLFGSYHSNDARVFKLSDSTFSALLSVDAVVLEADIYQLFISEDMRLGEAILKFDANGKPYTSSNKASETKYGTEDGRPQFLDLYFQQMAYNMGKGFYPLETIEDQIEALDFVYERTNAQKSLEQLKFTQDDLLNAYLRGDIEHVKTLIENHMNHSKAAYDRLIVKRNLTMANGIDTLCRKQSVFVAVGAGHLAGEEGIIQLLRKKGYQVRQVAASYSDPKSDAEKKLQQYNSYTYQSKNRGFRAVFGGKPLLDTNVAYYRLIYQEMGQGNSYIIEIEDLQDTDLASYAADVINTPEKSTVSKLMHQGKYEAFEGVGYEYAAGLSWKRVFIVNGKLVKLICYGGNKFMNSNRPKNFFDKVLFE